MKSRTMIVATAMLAITISSGWTFLKTTSTATSMTEAAETFLGSLTAEQKEKAFFAKYAAPERVGWHFIPKAERQSSEERRVGQECIPRS